MANNYNEKWDGMEEDNLVYCDCIYEYAVYKKTSSRSHHLNRYLIKERVSLPTEKYIRIITFQDNIFWWTPALDVM